MNNYSKSSTVAGLLGVFWGSFGLHNWYLGQKKQGMAHLALIGLGTIFLVAAASLSTKVETTSMLFADSTSVALGSYKIYITLSLIIAVGNALWGFISGVIILLQGDAGLAKKGIITAQGDFGSSVDNMDGRMDALGGGASDAIKAGGNMNANISKYTKYTKWTKSVESASVQDAKDWQNSQGEQG